MVASGGSGAILGLRPHDQSRPFTSTGRRPTCLVGLRRSLVSSRRRVARARGSIERIAGMPRRLPVRSSEWAAAPRPIHSGSASRCSAGPADDRRPRVDRTMRPGSRTPGAAAGGTVADDGREPASVEIGFEGLLARLLGLEACPLVRVPGCAQAGGPEVGLGLLEPRPGERGASPSRPEHATGRPPSRRCRAGRRTRTTRGLSPGLATYARAPFAIGRRTMRAAAQLDDTCVTPSIPVGGRRPRRIRAIRASHGRRRPGVCAVDAAVAAHCSESAWADRDRFILSAGHGSMLLYTLLYLTGYDLSLDQIRQFRQWDSRTPGHPRVTC